jgi:hypothetical protein
MLEHVLFFAFSHMQFNEPAAAAAAVANAAPSS